MFNYDDIPEWIQKVESEPTMDDTLWDIHKAREIVSQLNYLKGSCIGYMMKIDELEEKLAIALEYQREVDAQLLEKRGDSFGAKVLREGE